MMQCDRHDDLLSTVLKAADKMDTVARKTTEIHELLIGNYDREGLINKVHRHERSLCGIWRFSWLIIGTFVALLGASIWAAIT